MPDCIDRTEWIVLIAYSSAATIALMISLILYVVKSKIYARCVCANEGGNDDQQHLNTRFVDSGEDTISRRIYRTQSVPLRENRQRVVSEYDSIMGRSRPAPKTDHPPHHYYEEMREPTASRENPFKLILADVTSALSEAHGSAASNDELYETFLKALLVNIRNKDLVMYETIHNNFLKHAYEQVYEANQLKGKASARSSADEDVYSTYIPSLSRQLVKNANSTKQNYADLGQDMNSSKEINRMDNNTLEGRHLQAKKEWLGPSNRKGSSKGSTSVSDKQSEISDKMYDSSKLSGDGSVTSVANNYRMDKDFPATTIQIETSTTPQESLALAGGSVVGKNLKSENGSPRTRGLADVSDEQVETSNIIYNSTFQFDSFAINVTNNYESDKNFLVLDTQVETPVSSQESLASASGSVIRNNAKSENSSPTRTLQIPPEVPPKPSNKALNASWDSIL